MRKDIKIKMTKTSLIKKDVECMNKDGTSNSSLIVEEIPTFTHFDKQNLKNDLKSKVKIDFIVGDKYLLQYRNKRLNKVFILKKFIYCVNDEPLNIVVMKQITGPLTNRYNINREDCLRFHIKYEKGLQVFSMSLNWKHLKNK